MESHGNGRRPPWSIRPANGLSSIICERTARPLRLRPIPQFRRPPFEVAWPSRSSRRSIKNLPFRRAQPPDKLEYFPRNNRTLRLRKVMFNFGSFGFPLLQRPGLAVIDRSHADDEKLGGDHGYQHAFHRSVMAFNSLPVLPPCLPRR